MKHQKVPYPFGSRLILSTATNNITEERHTHQSVKFKHKKKEKLDGYHKKIKAKKLRTYV